MYLFARYLGQHIDVVRELLRGGASPRVADQHGQTPRTLAANAGQSRVVECLDNFLAPMDEPGLLEAVMPALALHPDRSQDR